MQTENLSPFEIFHNLTLSAILNNFRVLRAQAISLKTKLTIKLLKTIKGFESNEFIKEHKFLEELFNVSYDEYEMYDYISNSAFLVFFTTNFDSYLSSVTKFLFLLFPNSIGNKLTLSSDILLNLDSKWEIINKIVEDKTREVGYKSFIDRISFLTEKFGVKINIEDFQKDLELISSLRNSVIHDQNYLDILLDDNGKVVSQQVKDIRAPFPISDDNLKTAEKTYRKIITDLYIYISTEILKSEDLDSMNMIVNIAKRKNSK
jgi:RNAse (barnase) inhibitor barstar